jgi:hypothetical protein
MIHTSIHGSKKEKERGDIKRDMDSFLSLLAVVVVGGGSWS